MTGLKVLTGVAVAVGVSTGLVAGAGEGLAAGVGGVLAVVVGVAPAPEVVVGGTVAGGKVVVGLAGTVAPVVAAGRLVEVASPQAASARLRSSSPKIARKVTLVFIILCLISVLRYQ